MMPTTEASVEAEFGPGRRLVAAMGAVSKPSCEVRPLHDATHGVGLNNKIHEAAFAISADISQAHRRVKVRRADWPKLGCRSTSSSRTIWLNLVGTFGVSSAAVWWARLFGLIGRWVLRVMLTLWNMQLVYVDDLHLLAAGPDKFLILWMILAACEVVGTPCAYHKFKRGVAVDYIGYHVSYTTWSAGVSDSRARWIISWTSNDEEAGWVVVGRTVIEPAGRLTFVARVLPWLKPFLAPLHSWTSVLARGTACRMPALVHLSLIYIRVQLMEGRRLVPAPLKPSSLRQAFRTDAKCEQGRVVSGGWLLGVDADPSIAKWFCVELTPGQVPWLFKEDYAQ